MVFDKINFYRNDTQNLIFKDSSLSSLFTKPVDNKYNEENNNKKKSLISYLEIQLLEHFLVPHKTKDKRGINLLLPTTKTM